MGGGGDSKKNKTFRANPRGTEDANLNNIFPPQHEQKGSKRSTELSQT